MPKRVNLRECELEEQQIIEMEARGQISIEEARERITRLWREYNLAVEEEAKLAANRKTAGHGKKNSRRVGNLTRGAIYTGRVKRPD